MPASTPSRPTPTPAQPTARAERLDRRRVRSASQEGTQPADEEPKVVIPLSDSDDSLGSLPEESRPGTPGQSVPASPLDDRSIDRSIDSYMSGPERVV